MNVYRKLKVKSKGAFKELHFGEADTSEEVHESFKLRHQVYTEKGYISASRPSQGIEKDEHDVNGKCHYFIAKCDGKVIGVVRIIIDDPLPTEKCFEFDEPKPLLNIPRTNRCELGRFIIIPPDKERGEFLPRGLVMLFLLDVLSSFGLKNGFHGGYAFIKKSLEKKMKRLKMPVRNIHAYTQNYPEDGVLYKYFTQPNDPVIPVYFLTKDFSDYSQRRIHNWLIFKKTEDCFVLRNSLYLIFLALPGFGEQERNHP
jgi:N-acyl-L-homoserine lactone synthetase